MEPNQYMKICLGMDLLLMMHHFFAGKALELY
jgi:hypothetical protein